MKKLIRNLVNWAYGYDLGDLLVTLRREFEDMNNAVKQKSVLDKIWLSQYNKYKESISEKE